MNTPPKPDVNKTPANTSAQDYTQSENTLSARDHINAGQPSRPHRQGFMALLTFATALALSACGTTTPQPITSTTSSIGGSPQILNVQPVFEAVNAQAATGTSGNPTGATVTFDTSMDRASTERAIAIYPGEINPTSNPATFTTLGLTSMCNGNWRVRNPNAIPISFTWDVYNTTQKGVGVAPANSDVFFTSSQGSNTVRVFVGTKQQQTKATNPAVCTSSPYTFVWSADSKSVTVKPSSALVLGSTYSLAVSTLAKNSSGAQSLTSAYSSKFVVQENLSTSGTLVPGGSWTSRDGVVISAKPGVISQPINVFAEPIQSLQFPLPMPEGVDPIGQAFRVGTKPKTVWAKGNFDLLIPGPTRASGEDIRLYAFTPFPFVNQPEDIENGGVWGESTAKSNTLNQYATYDGALSPYATIFAFGRVRGSVKSSSSIPVVRTFSNPINEVECIGDLQKNDNELCPSDKNAVLQKLNNVLVDLKFDLGVTSDAFEKLESPLRIVSTLQGRCAKTDAVAFYDSNKREKNITLCYSLSKKTFGTDEEIIETLRHEVFHAIQYNYWQINEVRDMYFDENSRNLDFLIPENVKKIGDLISLFDKQQQWLVEGTAANIEKSRKAAPGLLSFSSYYGGARNVVHPLKFSSYTKPTLQIPYQTQDFWSFTSNQNGLGVGLLKHLLDNGKLSDSLEFSDKAIRSLNLEAYPEGLKSAYWEWAKTQAYQWKDPYKTINYPYKIRCVLDLETTYPDSSTGNNQKLFNLAAKADANTTESVQVKSLSTRIYRAYFSNAKQATEIKVDVDSNSTNLKFKVFTREKQKTSEPVCDGKEGSTLNPNSGSVSTKVTNETELVIIVANTDFTNPSSFTVTVAPVVLNTAPKIKQQTPNGLQDLGSNAITLNGQAGQSPSATLVISNEGDIGSLMEYTIHPLGNRTTSSVAIASIRAPISTPSGTINTAAWNPSLFQTRTGTLRHPQDPNTQTGATSVTLPISATCPSDIDSYSYGLADLVSGGDVDLVYSTGLIDDYGTPDDPSDDQPELEVLSIPISLNCTPPPSAQFLVSSEEIYATRGQGFGGSVVITNFGNATGTLSVSSDSGSEILVSGSVTLPPGQSGQIQFSGICPFGETEGPYYTVLNSALSFTTSGLVPAYSLSSPRVNCLDNRGVPSVSIPFFSAGYGTLGYGVPFNVANVGAQPLRYKIVVSVPSTGSVGVKPSPNQLALELVNINRISPQLFEVTNLPELAANSHAGPPFIVDVLCNSDQGVSVRIQMIELPNPGENFSYGRISVKEVPVHCYSSVAAQVGW